MRESPTISFEAEVQGGIGEHAGVLGEVGDGVFAGREVSGGGDANPIAAMESFFGNRDDVLLTARRTAKGVRFESGEDAAVLFRLQADEREPGERELGALRIGRDEEAHLGRFQ